MIALVGALGVVAVGTGLLVFTVNSMARATFLLLASFVAVAVLLIAFGLGYLGTVIVLMMTIEMMIMAVFMVMLMMNPAGLMPMTMVHNRWGSWAIALVVFGLLAAGAWLVPFPTTGRAAQDPTVALGDALMGPQMLTMMTLGLALLATIVGTVAVAVSRR
ncbi:NADH-quinone oxidoreductase subunit J [Actinomycetospora termitidis]|uniref:NADH-quinone oxidoreductase subunit J n=1 Tax=Actinomycetospora termitidis TaxID=3053470 RepID=A0ABT7MDN3_9PSEU|nr:NADH-quinone oxidoreductase subunit J [Actinomycetospora sp. Odt1-22]MDL5158576.1 NADH-quinone oxidoreductase subunit J [Actinomycetospora sp. Odt1-22]